MLLDRPPSPVHGRRRCRPAGWALHRKSRTAQPHHWPAVAIIRLRQNGRVRCGATGDDSEGLRRSGRHRVSWSTSGLPTFEDWPRVEVLGCQARRGAAPAPVAVSRTISPVPAARTCAGNRRRSLARARAGSADGDRVGRPTGGQVTQPAAAVCTLPASGAKRHPASAKRSTGKHRNFRSISASFFRFSAHRIRCV
jgi:hypothetical protein